IRAARGLGGGGAWRPGASSAAAGAGGSRRDSCSTSRRILSTRSTGSPWGRSWRSSTTPNEIPARSTCLITIVPLGRLIGQPAQPYLTNRGSLGRHPFQEIGALSASCHLPRSVVPGRPAPDRPTLERS